MFAITNNQILNVNHFRSGKKSNGDTYTLLTFVEKFNQPDDLERKSDSSSTVKMWDADINGKPTDGCQVLLESFEGVNWKHDVKTYNGKKVYYDVVEIVGAKVRVLD